MVTSPPTGSTRSVRPPADRAAREAATHELLERRAASTDEFERQQLLEQVVELNLEMAKGIARRFRGRGAEADDLEQVASLGLLKAAHHYRLDADTPFIGFAIPTIRGEVKRYFRDCAWTVRIPRRLQEMQGTIAGKLPELEQRLNREPTPAEIAEHLDVDPAEVEQALAARGCFNVLSLDRPAETDADLTLADVVADDEDATIDQLEAVDMLQPVLEDLGAARTADPAAAVRRGLDPVRDRRGHRRQPDAGLPGPAPHPRRPARQALPVPAVA